MNALILAAALASSATQSAPPRQPYGTETVILNASNGGITRFVPGPRGGSTVWLQDRTLRWYQVDLSGPCFPDGQNLSQLGFRTDPDGRLDRFSEIYSLRYPGRSCGIRRIVTSAPPLGQPGAAKAD